MGECASCAYLNIEEGSKEARGQPLAKGHQAVTRPRCQILNIEAYVSFGSAFLMPHSMHVQRVFVHLRSRMAWRRRRRGGSGNGAQGWRL